MVCNTRNTPQHTCNTGRSRQRPGGVVQPLTHCNAPATHVHHTCTTFATQAVFGNDEAGVRNPVGGERSQKSASKSFTHSSLSQCVKEVCCRCVASVLHVCCRCIYTLASFRVCLTLGSKNGLGMHNERHAPILFKFLFDHCNFFKFLVPLFEVCILT